MQININDPDDAANLRILSDKIINSVLDLKMQLDQNKLNLRLVAVLIPKQTLKSTTDNDYLTTLISLVMTKSPIMIQYTNVSTSNDVSIQFLLE